MITATLLAIALPQHGAPSIEAHADAFGAANRPIVKFHMPYLECFKTTEAGEDEIYLIVAGRWSNGGTFKYRYPNATQHWSLNDGEGDPPIRDIHLLNLEMNTGDYVDLAVLVMEEDGGTTKGWAALAGAVADALVPEAGGIFSVIAKFLVIEDSDDYIGSLKVRVFENNGDPYARIYAYERGFNVPDMQQGWYRWNIGFAGDGSHYKSTFLVSK